MEAGIIAKTANLRRLLMQRKRCSSCNRVRNIHYFYKRENGSADGYWNTCKDCDYARRNNYRYGSCEKCGERFYNVKYTLCKKCRKPEPEPVIPAMEDIRVCKPCTFLADCKRRVKQTDLEHQDWSPPCFEDSKYHEAWLKEYA